MSGRPAGRPTVVPAPQSHRPRAGPHWPGVSLRHRVLAAAVLALTAVAVVLVVAAVGHRSDPHVSRRLRGRQRRGRTGLRHRRRSCCVERAARQPPGSRSSPSPVWPSSPSSSGARWRSRRSRRPAPRRPGPATLVWAGLVADPLFFPVPLALALLLFPDGHLPSSRWRPVVWVAAGVTAARVVVVAVAARAAPGRRAYGCAPALARSASAARQGRHCGRSTRSCSPGRTPRAPARGGVGGCRATAGRRARNASGCKPLAVMGLVAIAGLLPAAGPRVARRGRRAARHLRGAAAADSPRGRRAALPGLGHRPVPRRRRWSTAGSPWLVASCHTPPSSRSTASVAGAPAPDLGPALVAVFLVALLLGPLRRGVEHAARRLGVRRARHAVRAAGPPAAPARARPGARRGAAAHRRRARHRARRAAGTSDCRRRRCRAGRLGARAAGRRRGRTLVRGARCATSASDVGDDRGPGGGGAAARRGRPPAACTTWPHRPVRLLRSVALSAELERRLEQITEQSALLARQPGAPGRGAGRGAPAARARHPRRRAAAACRPRRAAAGAETAVASGDRRRTPRRSSSDARADLDRCIDDLRELARGIYPPVLASARARPGPEGARPSRRERRAGRRRAGARRSPTADREVETAVYFTALEALQNTAKHAPDRRWSTCPSTPTTTSCASR